MATLLLKSIITGYALVAAFTLVMYSGNLSAMGGIAVIFIMPIILWHATLIVSGLALLVYKAIEEQKGKKH